MSIFDRLNQSAPQMNMQQLQSDPIGAAKQAGYQIPDNLKSDPRAMVMHLIQSGQVKGPMMQRIQPMLNMLMGGRR